MTQAPPEVFPRDKKKPFHFPVVPMFPEGSTPYSILAALNYLSFRKRLVDFVNPFLTMGKYADALNGLNAKRISAAAFGRNFPLEKFLAKYTLFPVYEKVTGHTPVLDRRIRNVDQTNWHHLRFSAFLETDSHMSWCNECLDEDVQTFGMPLWKVMHQVWFIDHCPRHKTPLLTSCNHCGQAFKQHQNCWLLPSEDCQWCGSKVTPEPEPNRCDAYWRLVRFIENCFYDDVDNPIPFSLVQETWHRWNTWERRWRHFSPEWDLVAPKFFDAWRDDPLATHLRYGRQPDEHAILTCLIGSDVMQNLN
ncbi:TniQ family protein [Variovorax sp. HJSM1_2]|uniref:TniQ family protein n=1 Tax=Variovorax sp. HJSM1_2 TaxID=3366263 RepID=UPI003BEBA6CD